MPAFNEEWNQLLLKWQSRLELNNWVIYIIREERQDVMRLAHTERLKTERGLVLSDVYDDRKSNIAFVRMYELNEYNLLHELLHVKYPSCTEKEIVTLTNVIWNANK